MNRFWLLLSSYLAMITVLCPTPGIHWVIPPEVDASWLVNTYLVPFLKEEGAPRALESAENSGCGVGGLGGGLAGLGFAGGGLAGLGLAGLGLAGLGFADLGFAGGGLAGLGFAGGGLAGLGFAGGGYNDRLFLLVFSSVVAYTGNILTLVSCRLFFRSTSHSFLSFEITLLLP